jgi:hypothetical protein
MDFPQVNLTKVDAERYWQESESFFEAIGGVLI